MAGNCYCCIATCYGGSPSSGLLCAWGAGSAALLASHWISGHCGGSGGSMECGHYPDAYCQ